MESDSASTEIEKSNNSNYHFWKMRVQHVLTLKDLENFLEEDPPVENGPMPNEISQWKKKDKKAQAIIGVTLSDDLLVEVWFRTSRR